MLEHHSDSEIAEILNAQGLRPGVERSAGGQVPHAPDALIAVPAKDLPQSDVEATIDRLPRIRDYASCRPDPRANRQRNKLLYTLGDPALVEINFGRRDRARTYGCFAWATQPDNGLYDA